MKYTALALVVLAGCDPQTLSCPTPDTCGDVSTAPTEPAAPVAHTEPSVTIPAPPRAVNIAVVQTGSIEWHIDCGTPAYFAGFFRDAVKYWNRAVPGIYAAEGDCQAGLGQRFWVADAPGKAWGYGGPWGVVLHETRLDTGMLYSVMLHEVGHAMGMGHGGPTDCLMDSWIDGPYMGLCAAEEQALKAAYPSGLLGSHRQ